VVVEAGYRLVTLQQEGIDVNKRTWQKSKASGYTSSLTALQIAQETGQESIARLLEEYAAKPAPPMEAPKAEPLYTTDVSPGSPEKILETL
jgi:hypothetical protein